ncbi:MAG: hypothetical protein KFF68_16775 [Desulfosarcina sp.]|nr:hypothetical protein [Desulfosarcina sp.]
MPSALFYGLRFKLKFFGIAQFFFAYRAPSAVSAKVRRGLDQFFKCRGVGFEIAFVQKGAEGFFSFIIHCVFGTIKGEWPDYVQGIIRFLIHGVFLSANLGSC